jgi:hypothetical protein
LARFWAAVLDGYDVAPYDDAELALLREMGIDDIEDDPTVLVEAPRGVPSILLPTRGRAKAVKNRWHLDLSRKTPKRSSRDCSHLARWLSPTAATHITG